MLRQIVSGSPQSSRAAITAMWGAGRRRSAGPASRLLGAALEPAGGCDFGGGFGEDRWAACRGAVELQVDERVVAVAGAAVLGDRQDAPHGGAGSRDEATLQVRGEAIRLLVARRIGVGNGVPRVSRGRCAVSGALVVVRSRSPGRWLVRRRWLPSRRCCRWRARRTCGSSPRRISAEGGELYLELDRVVVGMGDLSYLGGVHGVSPFGAGWTFNAVERLRDTPKGTPGGSTLRAGRSVGVRQDSGIQLQARQCTLPRWLAPNLDPPMGGVPRRSERHWGSPEVGEAGS